MKTSVLLFALAFFFLKASEPEDVYPEKELKELAFFGLKNELTDFMEFKNGDVIADIGAGDGTYANIFSLYFDSLTFYIEDINPKDLNQKKLNKVIKHYTGVRGKPITNKFHIAIGTVKSTELPDSTFDKIILKASFHEFTYVDEMMTDISRKLKKGGKIYMFEAFSYKDHIIYCDEGHRGYKISEVVEIMNRFGFFLTKMKSPESDVPNYANTLIFEKDASKSQAYTKKVSLISEHATALKKLSQRNIAIDSMKVKSLADSLVNHITDFKNTYPCFQSWLKGFGIVWLEKREYACAIQVFKMVLRFFPNSYDAHYWLGRAYEKNNRKKIALTYYKQSLELNPKNTLCRKRLDQLK